VHFIVVIFDFRLIIKTYGQ